MARLNPSSHPDDGQVGTGLLRELLLREMGTRLTYIRGEAKQAEFANVAGLHKNTLGTYERGEREIGALALQRLVWLGWNANWLLTGEGPERLQAFSDTAEPAPSQEMSGEALTIAVELADEALRGLWLPKRHYFDLVALIYDGITKGLPYAEIIEFTRPVASKLANERRSDDGRSEVDGPSTGDLGSRAVRSGGKR
jgi:hypothetical protein